MLPVSRTPPSTLLLYSHAADACRRHADGVECAVDVASPIRCGSYMRRRTESDAASRRPIDATPPSLSVLSVYSALQRRVLHTPLTSLHCAAEERGEEQSESERERERERETALTHSHSRGHTAIHKQAYQFHIYTYSVCTTDRTEQTVEGTSLAQTRSHSPHSAPIHSQSDTQQTPLSTPHNTHCTHTTHSYMNTLKSS